MKTRYIIALGLLLSACSRDNAPEEIQFLDSRYLSLLDVNLLPGVKTLATETFAPERQNEQIVAGRLLARNYHEFSPAGLCTRTITYTVLPTGDYTQDGITDYEFDDKMRVTRETTSRANERVQLLYLYDDRARTATCYEYRDDIPVSKTVYPLRDNGHIHWSLSERYAPSRATPVVPLVRIVLSTDARGNWTESYLQEEHPTAPSTLSDYTKRQITYY